jgi:hypothetical protein
MQQVEHDKEEENMYKPTVRQPVSIPVGVEEVSYRYREPAQKSEMPKY